MKHSTFNIEKLYSELEDHWGKKLEKKGVRLPKLYYNGKYSKNALVLTYLYHNFQKPVSKEELTNFVKKYYPETNDVQQGRHLAAQSGWYILSRTRKDIKANEYNLKEGEYMLYSLDKSYPNFTHQRRNLNMDGEGWENLKKEYGYRCATCGSKEGKPNIHYPSTITTLQKGHMDPSKPLDGENIIPQCEKCNRPDRNYFVYNKKGRVIKIADPRFVLRSKKSIKKEMLNLLKSEFN